MATKESHKIMSGRPLKNGALERWQRRYGLDSNFDPKTEGGFILKEDTPIKYVKAPFWREEKNNPNLTRSDIRPLHIAEAEKPWELSTIKSGGELELYVWDPEKHDLAEVLGPESKVPDELTQLNEDPTPSHNGKAFECLTPQSRKIGYSAELARGCIEMNFQPSHNPQETAASLLYTLGQLADVTEKHHGWYVTPISNFPNREISHEDTNPDPYVQRMAMEFIGWENVRHFTGSSWQVHVEMIDLKSGTEALNQYQIISPLLYGISLAGPFGYGSSHPNLSEYYIADEAKSKRLNDSTYEGLRHNDWMSIRYPSRWRGSPSGGVFETPLPTSPSEFFSHVEVNLRNNDPESDEKIPSPARAAGHHRDRVRIDIPPHGTLEISNMDTFAGNVTKLAVSQEFTRVLMWKLQLISKANRFGKLSEALPSLFTSEVTPEQLKNAHESSIKVAKHGLDTTLIGADGNEYSGNELFQSLIAFVDAPFVDESSGLVYNGLPDIVKEELDKSIQIPTPEMYKLHADSNGVPSMMGYYETGIGTASHWMKERVNALMGKGFDEKSAINNCMADLGRSYHAFLKNYDITKFVDSLS